ncbi:MAG: hypothetical protein K9L85_02940 [Candidatus Peribacteraceae bacterium]|nr:hypothetical protein [Candidatus Peribacteraceae bacterium]
MPDNEFFEIPAVVCVDEKTGEKAEVIVQVRRAVFVRLAEIQSSHPVLSQRDPTKMGLSMDLDPEVVKGLLDECGVDYKPKPGDPEAVVGGMKLDDPIEPTEFDVGRVNYLVKEVINPKIASMSQHKRNDFWIRLNGAHEFMKAKSLNDAQIVLLRKAYPDWEIGNHYSKDGASLHFVAKNQVPEPPKPPQQQLPDGVRIGDKI